MQTNSPKSNIYLAISKSPLAVGLDQQEITLASQAEINALEKGVTGLPLKWTSQGNSAGSVTPGQSFSIGAAICRRYKRTIENKGISSSESATACKGDDGTWAVLD